MFAYHGVRWIVLASVFVWTGQASAGWVIDQVMKGGSESSRQQLMLQGNRMKTLVLGKDGNPIMAIIHDLNADTITQVDYAERSYTTATLQEYVQMVRGAGQAASAQMAQAMKQMQETLKDLPPEQRKMMEEMMRSQGQAGATPAECREPRMEVRKTGQQATIAGYPAVRYDILADGKLESELWIARGITAWRELDLQKLERFSTEMMKLAGCAPGQRRQMLSGADPSFKLASDGYAVRMVDRSGSGSTVEVVKAESRTIPASEFQPPSGFTRRTLREMGAQ